MLECLLCFVDIEQYISIILLLFIKTGYWKYSQGNWKAKVEAIFILQELDLVKGAVCVRNKLVRKWSCYMQITRVLNSKNLLKGPVSDFFGGVFYDLLLRFCPPSRMQYIWRMLVNYFKNASIIFRKRGFSLQVISAKHVNLLKAKLSISRPGCQKLKK